MRKLPLALGLLAAVYGMLALIPVDRSNPPVTTPLAAPADAAAIFERSCYDCHSNETRWPWYAWLPPASWLVAHDVEEGRAHMNFSTCGSYSPKEQAKLRREVLEEIEKGAMPLGKYLLLHPGARVSPAELEILRAWARGAGAAPDGAVRRAGDEAGSAAEDHDED